MTRYSFEGRDTFFNRLDPVSKLVWLVCVTTLAISITTFSAQAALLVLVLLSAAFLARTPPARLWSSTKYFLLMSTSYFFLQFIFVPGQHVLADLWGLKLTWEALDWAAATALRVYILVVASLIFVITTSPRHLAQALHQKLRINYVVAHMFFLGLRYLPLVEETFKNIREAQMVRGVGENPGLRGKMRDFKRYAVPLLTTMLERGRITAWAMDSRGFRAFPTRTHTDIIVIQPQGRLLAAVSLLVTAGYLAAVWLWQWHPPTLASLMLSR